MNSPFKNLLNRPIIINGDFYQHCYDMAIDDIIEYYAYNNTYISNAFNWKKERMLKTAVPTQIFNNITTIKLGKYYFNCPENPVKYLESKQRYGTNSIQSPAKRGAKPLDFQNCQ